MVPDAMHHPSFATTLNEVQKGKYKWIWTNPQQFLSPDTFFFVVLSIYQLEIWPPESTSLRNFQETQRKSKVSKHVTAK